MTSTLPFAPAGPAEAELRTRLAAVRLYVVSNAAHSPERTIEVVGAALAGGADAVQLRRKTDDARETLRLAEACAEACRRAGALFIVDDRVDIAIAAGADGVHLGQDDLPVAAARRLWPHGLVGRSTHSSEQQRRAELEGADYCGVGPVHATPSKPGRAAVGLGLVAKAAATLRLPWVAIGGIDLAGVDAVLAAGARAVAVVRAVTDAADPEAAARALRARVSAAAAGERR